MGVQCLPSDDCTVQHLVRLGKVRESRLPKGCGLSLGIEVGEYPENFPEHLTGRAAVQKLEEIYLEEAIRRWNRRSLEPQNASA